MIEVPVAAWLIRTAPPGSHGYPWSETFARNILQGASDFWEDRANIKLVIDPPQDSYVPMDWDYGIFTATYWDANSFPVPTQPYTPGKINVYFIRKLNAWFPFSGIEPISGYAGTSLTSRLWVDKDVRETTMAHELGHKFGLGDRYDWWLGSYEAQDFLMGLHDKDTFLEAWEILEARRTGEGW